MDSDLHIPYPPRDIFEQNLTPAVQVAQEEQGVFIIDHVEYPESGGIFVYLKGVLYPTKGFPTPEAVWANNLVKKYLITQFKFFFKTKIIFFFLFLPNKLEKLTIWLNSFTEFGVTVLQSYFLKENRYCELCRELRKLIANFLMGIGVNEATANEFAREFAHLIEYDTAYRLRIEDILSETTSQKLKIAPRQEIKRLLRILAVRENRTHLVQKFKWFGLGLSLILLFPKVKRAFNKALDSIDFTKLQFDEADHYHCLRLSGYEFMGRTLEDRMIEYCNLHGGNMPKQTIIHAELSKVQN